MSLIPRATLGAGYSPVNHQCVGLAFKSQSGWICKVRHVVCCCMIFFSWIEVNKHLFAPRGSLRQTQKLFQSIQKSYWLYLQKPGIIRRDCFKEHNDARLATSPKCSYLTPIHRNSTGDFPLLWQLIPVFLSPPNKHLSNYIPFQSF